MFQYPIINIISNPDIMPARARSKYIEIVHLFLSSGGGSAFGGKSRRPNH